MPDVPYWPSEIPPVAGVPSPTMPATNPLAIWNAMMHPQKVRSRPNGYGGDTGGYSANGGGGEFYVA
jgi:hypothetical protein